MVEEGLTTSSRRSLQADNGSPRRQVNDSARETSREREAGEFFRRLYGEDAPGFVAIWTRQNSLTEYVEASDPDKVAGVVTRLAGHNDVYFGVGIAAA